jgi:hypothetical protein
MSETPALSPTIAHLLVDESPLHARSAHRLLGNKPRPSTDAQRKGRLYHQLIVPGGSRIKVFDYDAWRSDAAKADRAAALKAGQTPILQAKYDEAMVAVERIKARLRDEGIDLDGGQTEVRLEWNEPSDLGDVLCHGHLDWLSNDHLLIRDLKTTDGSVKPEACAKALINQGSVIQHAAYLSAVTRLWPDLAGRVKMQFIFAETREPYAVTVAECAGSMAELGESKWMRAIALWARCLKNDQWPGPAQGVARLEAPAWAIALAHEEEHSE